MPPKGKNTLALEAMVKAKNEELFNSVQHTYVELAALKLRKNVDEMRREKSKFNLEWDPIEHILTLPPCLYNLSDYTMKQIPLYMNPRGKNPALLKPKKTYVSLLGPPSVEEQKKAAKKRKEEFEAKVNAAIQNNKRKNRMYFYQTVQKIPTLPALDTENYVRTIQDCNESIKNNAQDIENLENEMVEINRQHTLTALKVYETERKIEFLEHLWKAQITPRYEHVEWEFFECRLKKIELEDDILSGLIFKEFRNRKRDYGEEERHNEDFEVKKRVAREYPDFT